MRLDDSVEAVLLDAGGVLVLPSPHAMRAAVARFGAEPDDETCRRAHYAGVEALDRLGEANWPEIDKVVASTLGVAPRHLEEVVPAMSDVYQSEEWVAAPGAAAGLRALEEAGLRLAIVSNATGTMERMLLAHRICGLDGDEMARVAVVVDSHIVGIEKPDPRIFSHALEALRLSPDRCIFVGDSVHFDVAGAVNASIRPVHFNPYRLCEIDDHAHVASLTDLLPVRA